MRNIWVPAALLMAAAGWGANQFSPLLGAYERDLGLSASTATGLLAVYVVGLVPGLLLGGPLADRRGRKPVVCWAIVLNAVATAALMLGAHQVPWLVVGRVLVGISTGSVLAAGAAWVRELSHPPFGSATEDGAGARRAGALLAAGFSLSGFGSALVATWGPAPLISAYAPHLVLCAMTLPWALRCPETRVRGEGSAPRGRALRDPRFWRAVAPVAPWVFVTPPVAFAVLPGLVTAHQPRLQVLCAGVATLLAPGLGALVQPLARRLARHGPRLTAVIGLTGGSAGLVLAAVAGWFVSPWLGLPAALLLGVSYGFTSTYCLTMVGRIAGPTELAGLTAVMWVLAYVGFFVPFVVSLLAPIVPAQVVLLVLAGLALLALLAREQPDGDGQERRRAQRVQRLRDAGVL
ncbi:MFS transporter [Saccharopolyspora griseoalba]|uniref:MFS transporter n=1 Tax=Saccharopolyspora griseoalba TaxID=1431848 RepID=A0ABW2LHV5_9PSEU